MAGSAAFFNTVAEEYADWYGAESPGGCALRERRRRVLELLGHSDGMVLDVGCGPAVMSQEISGNGWQYSGVDASSKMIAEARQRVGEDDRMRFAVGDATQLPFAAETFDAVIAIGVIDRIRADAAAIAEMARVTKQNGMLIVAFPNLIGPYAAWKAFAYYPVVACAKTILSRGPRSEHATMLSSFPRLRTVRSASRLMAAQGVDVTQEVFYSYNLFLSPLDEIFPRLAIRQAKRCESCHRGALSALGAGFLLKGRKA